MSMEVYLMSSSLELSSSCNLKALLLEKLMPHSICQGLYIACL